ncbi:MAG TPA: Vms1/Ankzf1 family peptidyl-tRNA hydrolase [Actinospica sp.]|nr:Vms1/Ankzf1 family peptidyl-tRNA hydrolase [Actinospica sp.]
MTTGMEIEPDALRSLYTARGPFATVYFALQAHPELELTTEARWQDLLHRLAERGAKRELAALTREYEAHRLEAGRLVAIAADGAVILSVVLPENADNREDQATWGSLPHLLPLLAWRQQHPAHVVAVVDRTGADLELYGAGATDAQRVRVEGPDDEIERNRPGGMSQMRYQHRAEDSWEHNAAAVAKAVADALRKVDAHTLMLAGDVRARQYLLKHLPTWAREHVAVQAVSGGRSADGARARRAGQVEEAANRAGYEETAAVMSEFAEQRSPSGTAVEGGYATLRALAHGRLRTLLVSDAPDARRTAWFGAGPADVTRRRTEASSETGPRMRGALVDVAVRAAMLSGAGIRVIDPDPETAPSQGIGGLCRYARTAAA